MVRALYGTGVFLKLNKRNCDMRIRLTPFDCDMLRIHWRIDGENYYFIASGVMGSQFSAFLSAVYGLYEEEDHSHYLHTKYDRNITHEYPYICEDRCEDGRRKTEAKVFWDGEGPFYIITFTRISENGEPVLDPNTPDPVKVQIKSSEQPFKECVIDGRDLCYAVARGCTEALKKYGFKGYTKTSGGYDLGDAFSIEELLFVKAYALGALDICKAEECWKNPNSWRKIEATNFEREIELLLFDM